MKLNNLKFYIGSILIIFLILLSWKIAYTTNCLSLVFPLIILLTISSSFIELKVHDRICFRNCFFKKQSLFSKVLTAKFFIIIFYIIVSIAMTITIMYSMLDYTLFIWIYLIFHIILVIYIFKKLQKIFTNTVENQFLNLFSKEWTINISSIILFFVYAYVVLNGYVPSYLTDNLNDTIINASKTIKSNCLIIDTVLRFKVEVDSLFWWITNQTSENISNTDIKALAWSAFIFINSLAILGLNRFIVQVIYLTEKVFHEKRAING